MRELHFKTVVLLFHLLCLAWLPALAGQPDIRKKVDDYIRETLPRTGIPGLSLVLISGGEQTILNYGYADRDAKKKVGEKTLFQLGSCSKAFTALAVENLVHEGKLKLDHHVSFYIPWFSVAYKDSAVDITLRQLMHHTSGIPWNTISRIPQTNSEDALDQTVRAVAGITLRNAPGEKFEYATVHYDILALVVERVTHQSFESYLQEKILNKLGLDHTTIGVPADSALMSRGYKISFFRPHVYDAPVYRGNNAAGYVISNAEDMAKWLRFQMGHGDTTLYPLASSTHQRDETVYPHNMSSYAGGWNVSLKGDGAVYHGGLNPNFTAFVAFRPRQDIGVVVLANSNSGHTEIIGSNVLRLLAGEKVSSKMIPDDNNDGLYATVSFILLSYILTVMVFVAMIVADTRRKRRVYQRPTAARLTAFGLSLVMLIPFLYGVYKIPDAMAGFSWQPALVWSPGSFPVFIVLLLASIGISYLASLANICYPAKNNKIKMVAPQLLLMSILSGISNMGVILLITSALGSDVELKYLVLYYVLTLTIYLLGRRFVQVNIIKLTREVIYDLRINLIDKIFSTSYQQFEKIDRGRIYTALNDDVSAIGESTNMFVMLVTSFFTAVGAFIYLASIAFWAAVLTVFLILTLTTLYFFVSKSTNHYFEEARNTRNVFMRLINGMIDGFKEITLHRKKKLEFKADMADSAMEYKMKTSIASIRFVNASLVGESTLIVILGTVALAFPKVFPDIESHILMSFIVILLYLIGPVNTILNSIPAVMRLKIAWKRVQQLLNDIPPAATDAGLAGTLPPGRRIKSFKVNALRFRYQAADDLTHFEIGPIDFSVNSGEILFIIGGNGSGKTTLAKLLAGLYIPDEGKIMIDDKAVTSTQLSENFSVVFNPLYLFNKLYGVDAKGRSADINAYLKTLDLDRKVVLNANSTYNTTDLSGGQRKRLALLQCYLEDSPIYLFDEWAADQDPGYRLFFYKTLLPQMKHAGKIVIAITHDDKYFDVADRILKMDQGRLETYEPEVLMAK